MTNTKIKKSNIKQPKTFVVTHSDGTKETITPLPNGEFRSELSFNAPNSVPVLAGFNYRVQTESQANTVLDTLQLSQKAIEKVGQKPASDFIFAPFRCLSNTIVAPFTWRATEFPLDVLKESMPLLKDNGIYLDHYAYTDNCIGKVVEVSWSNETMQGETRIPAGIDGNFAIDKLHTTVVSNILSGALYSDSVTVSFDWKPSHGIKDGEYFGNFIGDMHQDGTMYRRIATKIHQYKEVSIVNLGADPYAKMRDENGQLMKIETTSSFSEDKTKDAYIIESVASEMLALSDRFNKQTQTNTHNSISDLSNENKADLSTSNVAQITELQTSVTAQKNEIAQLTAKYTDLEQSFASKERVYLSEATTLKAQITTLEGEKTRLKDIETSLQGTNASLISQNESLQSESKDYKVYLDLARKETLRLYQLSTNTRSATVESTIQNGSMEQLNDMIQSFGAKSLTTFGAKCGKCGSSDLNFKNSVATPLSGKATEYKDNSREAVIARLSQK